MKNLLTHILITWTLFPASLNAQDICIDLSLIDTTAFCIAIYAPVCGCDGITYANSCQAENFGGVTDYVEGECKQTSCRDSSLINELILCTAVVDPVCGCDGETYINACVAQYQHGITSWTRGACAGNFCIDSSQIDTSLVCPTVYDPVCGCDGITYGNDCEARRNGVSSWSQGSCGDEICQDSNLINALILCSTIYDPVCGCDGNTYSNECIAKFRHGITQYTNGPCIDPGCIDSSRVDTTVLCSEEYDPVCGCDGVTYSNECIASNQYGVTEWTPGECGQHMCIDSNVINSLILCAEIYDPVCGCDEHTHANACVAKYHHGVTAWTEGECTITSTTSENADRIKIFPNPTTSWIQLQFHPLMKFKVYELISSHGQLYRREEITSGSGSLTINIEDLPSGAYWIRLRADEFVQVLSMLKL